MKRLVLVGMNPRTRPAIPWESDAEIWTLNEVPSQDWLKRYDVLFQLHPRWDWERENNPADPNHPLYIKAQSGTCLHCAGKGCQFCKDGQYILPPHRVGKHIIMQDHNDDVPGCVRFPIEGVTRRYCTDGRPYFTSTLAHMMIGAIALAEAGKYSDILLYGFECESNTEYAEQRPCAEHWQGYAQGLGLHIDAPGSGLFKGPHYAYDNTVQGYRTRLFLRKQHLQAQLAQAEAAALREEGALTALAAFRTLPEITPAYDIRFDDHFKKKSFVTGLRVAIQELDNLINMYDAYYVDGGKKPDNLAAMLTLTYEIG